MMKRAAEWAKERGGGGLAAVAAQGLGGAAEEVGGGAYAVLDREAKEDELRDYERLCASGKRWCRLP